MQETYTIPWVKTGVPLRWIGPVPSPSRAARDEFATNESVPSYLEPWLELNAKYSVEWPNITEKKEPPADADEHKGEEGKFDKYFSPEPGAGD